MAVREKFGERGGALLRLLRFRDREKEKTALGYALNFALGLLLANARIMTDIAPFALAAVGCAEPDASGVSCLLGASFG